MHASSLQIFSKYVVDYIEDDMSILEVGPGQRSAYLLHLAKVANKSILWHYASWWPRESRTRADGSCVYGLVDPKYLPFDDMPEEWRLKYGNQIHRIEMPDDNTISCPDNTYDMVLTGQVIEHVRQPWIWVKELARVAKSYLVIIGPNTWPQHGAPSDYWRIWPAGMRVLLQEADLEVLFVACEGSDTIGIGKKKFSEVRIREKEATVTANKKKQETDQKIKKEWSEKKSRWLEEKKRWSEEKKKRFEEKKERESRRRAH